MRTPGILYLSILTVYLCSCNSAHLKDVLIKAERAMSNNPDSALALLQSVRNPDKLSMADFAAYQLAYTKAKDKCYMDLAADTANILKSLTYYSRCGDDKEKGWANYYAGRVYQDAGKGVEAGLYLLKAANLASQISDPLLGSMANYYLGDLHSNQYATDKALDLYKLAFDYYGKTSDRKEESVFLATLGFGYGMEGNIDSAVFYLREAFDMVKNLGDTMKIASIANSMSIYLHEDSQSVEAKKFQLLSLSLQKDSSMIPIQKISLADIYIGLHMPDSAALLLAEIKSEVYDSEDIELEAIYYSAWADLEAMKKNHETALTYYREYATCLDSIYQKQRKSSLAETEQMYNYVRIEDANKELLLQKQNTRLVIFLLLVGLIFVSYILARINKQRKIDQMNAIEGLESLRKMQIESQEAVISASDGDVVESKSAVISVNSDKEKELVIKKALLQQLDIARKIAMLNGTSSDANTSFLKRFNTIFYGEQNSYKLDWKELYTLINVLYDNFEEKLRKQYGSVLSGKDIQQTCLLRADMDTLEIAFVMEHSVNTVRKRKTDIRRKLGMSDGADIVSGVLTLLNIQV